MARALSRCVLGQTKPPGDGPPKHSMAPPLASDRHWHGWSRKAPLDAPAGGGGLGGFGNGILGCGASSDDPYVHPRAPSVWYRLASADPDAGVPLRILPAPDAGAPKVNPPPLVERDQDIPGVTLHPNKTVDVELRGTMLADDHDDTPGNSGHTSINAEKTLELGAQYDGDKKITRIKASTETEEAGIPKVIITFSIQTIYGKDVDPAGPSAYGRGTTKDDQEKGNVTLGFHESCQRNDLKEYVRSFKSYSAKHPFPEFKGKVGMTLEQFKKEKIKFLTPEDPNNKTKPRTESKSKSKSNPEAEGEVDKFVSGLLDQILKETAEKTDEVGNKLSDYCRDNPDDAECSRKGN